MHHFWCHNGHVRVFCAMIFQLVMQIDILLSLKAADTMVSQCIATILLGRRHNVKAGTSNTTTSRIPRPSTVSRESLVTSFCINDLLNCVAFVWFPMNRFRYLLFACLAIILVAVNRLAHIVDYLDDLPVGLKQIADGKAHKGKVFCWIMTSRRNHENRARIVDETWPRRCDKYEFFTDDGNTTFPSAGIFYNLTDGHINLWPKTKTALRHIYDTYLNEFDWFLKADDDTYIVVENLKLMLGRFDARLPHYLGFRMKPYIENGFNSGGAGYVLSRAALAAFVEKAYNNETICKGGPAEDLELAYCLKNIGILPGDTRDATGHNTFFPYHPNMIINGKIPNDGDYNFWYYYQMKKSVDAFSANLISMHQLSATEMRLVDLLIYRVRVPSR